jgi:hypothetical protein
MSQFYAGLSKKEVLIGILGFIVVWNAVNAAVFLVHLNVGHTQKLSYLYRGTPHYKTVLLGSKTASAKNDLERQSIIIIENEKTRDTIAAKIKVLKKETGFERVNIQMICSKHYCNVSFSTDLQHNAHLLELAYASFNQLEKCDFC